MMETMELKPQYVKFAHKTGTYIGEKTEQGDRRMLVKVLAVLQHPTQGDLHSSFDPDPPLFHERRALAYTEKVWVPEQAAQSYSGAIPDYRESLASALGGEMEKMDRLKRWAEKCLGNLETLRRDYGK